MRLVVEKLVSGGDGLAVAPDGKKVFISSVLPHEEVEVGQVQEKSGYYLAEPAEIVQANEHRIDPSCPYWGICGGCDFQFADHEYQALCKQQIMLDNVCRLGAIDKTQVVVEDSVVGQAYNYRNRVRFHVDVMNKRVGFLGRKSSSLVPIKECPILTDPLNALLADPSRLFEAARKQMFANRTGKSGYIEVPAIANDKDASLSNKEILLDLAGRKIPVSAEVFFQSNRILTAELALYVASRVVGETVMDLYGGVGTFSAFLEGKRRTIVERQKECLALARKHLGDCEIYSDAVETWAKKRKQSAETVIVDPPRTGLDSSVPSLIASWNPRRVIYVSCNSVTMARDLQRFTSEGYTLRTIRLFDLYPQTFHHEGVAVLDRREN